MPRYQVTRNYSGYVRGYETREVTADSEEEAIRIFESGALVSEDIVRNDTNSDYSAEEVKPPKLVGSLTAAQKKLLASLKVK